MSERTYDANGRPESARLCPICSGNGSVPQEYGSDRRRACNWSGCYQGSPKRPFVIVGETRSSSLLVDIRRMKWGRIWSVGVPDPYSGEHWSLDNGAFSAWQKLKQFPEDQFLRRVEAASKIRTYPYMIVLPDIVGKGKRSLEFSLRWVDRMPSGWPLFLAVQDGITAQEVEPHLDLVSGVFLGGTDKFKVTAGTWAALARKHGKKFHYGRGSTIRKIRYAIHADADSFDTSFVLWERDRWNSFVEFFENGDNQTDMFARNTDRSESGCER